ncbi:MAG: response regulator [bacterium]|nr:response regulator [bacterium]
MHILLVDDTELFLDLERSYLERDSFTFSIARSGDEALEILRQKRPDLVILDLIMPGMEGDAVCREIKAHPATRNIPVIMVSSATREEFKDRCYAAGCNAFVAKPLKRDELLEAIERVIVIARRTNPRVPTHLPSNVRHGERELDAWIHTISVGGLFIEIDPPPESGEVLDIVFSLPQRSSTIRSMVQVRWSGRVRADGASGVGVQFLDIEETDKAAIGDYVEKKLSSVGSLKGFA